TTGLAASGVTGQTARAWANQRFSTDLKASVAVYVDSLIPAQLIIRGSSLDTANPSFYSLSITRGVNIQLSRTVNGSSVVLGQLTSNSYVSSKWVQISLQAVESTLRAQLYRLDTHQYLNASGNWQSAQTWALTKIDTAIRTGANVGLGRPGSYA